jgi:hypothetical protein
MLKRQFSTKTSIVTKRTRRKACLRSLLIRWLRILPVNLSTDTVMLSPHILIWTFACLAMVAGSIGTVRAAGGHCPSAPQAYDNESMEMLGQTAKLR